MKISLEMDKAHGLELARAILRNYKGMRPEPLTPEASWLVNWAMKTLLEIAGHD